MSSDAEVIKTLKAGVRELRANLRYLEKKPNRTKWDEMRLVERRAQLIGWEKALKKKKREDNGGK